MPLTALPLPDADLRYDPHWLPEDRADALFDALHARLPWETHRIRVFGRWHDAPRLSCWIGDAHARYRYSGVQFEPHAWTPALDALRTDLSALLDAPFNSVLANLYRDGRDAMGWHSDDEPELGPAPVIASVSLGASRRFLLKHRTDARHRRALDLVHGSLLVMAGDTQRMYRHALPRTTRAVGARINLTFRHVSGSR